nr:hypothetical protein 69 [bacterium]
MSLSDSLQELWCLQEELNKYIKTLITERDDSGVFLANYVAWYSSDGKIKISSANKKLGTAEEILEQNLGTPELREFLIYNLDLFTWGFNAQAS